MSMLDRALALLAEGYAIFPLRPNGKEPVTFRGFYDASHDEAQIRSWWATTPSANIGINTAMSGISVVDTDVKDGLKGEDALLALAAEHGGAEALPPTRTVRTRSGGTHRYYRDPALPQSNGRLAPGIDTRGAKGYVVAPGSIVEGSLYELVDDRPLAVVPNWLVEALAEKPRPTPQALEGREAASEEEALQRLAELVEELATAEPGTGNETASKVAAKVGQYVGAGQIPQDIALEALYAGVADWNYRDDRHQETTHRTILRQLEWGMREPRPWVKAVTLADLSGMVAKLKGGTTPANGKAVDGPWPGPEDPDQVAAKLGELWRNEAGDPLVTHDQGVFYGWRQAHGHWSPLLDEAINNRIGVSMRGRVYLDAKGNPQPWRLKIQSRAEIRASLAAGPLFVDRDGLAGLAPAYSGVFCRNGRVDVSTGELEAPNPAYLNMAATPYDYETDAQCPQWLAFLASSLDPESVAFIQEWFGYVLSGRRDLQKAALFVGRPRAGKSIVADTLIRLVGAQNAAAPTLSSLASRFGREGLIAKTVAVMADATWTVRDKAQAVEALKSIIGNDMQSIDRKNKAVWNGQLDCRFLIVSNDVPDFTDASGALASRFVVVEFKRSFVGREDPTLAGRVQSELPGILNWALEGARRLNARGYFVAPESGREIAQRAKDESSVTGAFLAEHAERDPEAPPVDRRRLLHAILAWQDANGDTNKVNEKRLRNELTSMGYEQTQRKLKVAPWRIYEVHGLREAFPGAFNDGSSGRF